MVGAIPYLRIGYLREKYSPNISSSLQIKASFQAILQVYSVFLVHLETGKNGQNPVGVFIGRGEELFWSHVETILARGVPISTFNTITSHTQFQVL